VVKQRIVFAGDVIDVLLTDDQGSNCSSLFPDLVLLLAISTLLP